MQATCFGSFYKYLCVFINQEGISLKEMMGHLIITVRDGFYIQVEHNCLYSIPGTAGITINKLSFLTEKKKLCKLTLYNFEKLKQEGYLTILLLLILKKKGYFTFCWSRISCISLGFCMYLLKRTNFSYKNKSEREREREPTLIFGIDF